MLSPKYSWPLKWQWPAGKSNNYYNSTFSLVLGLNGIRLFPRAGNCLDFILLPLLIVLQLPILTNTLEQEWLYWFDPVMIDEEELSIGPQTPMNTSGIPFRRLWKKEDITDAPLACGDKRLEKAHKMVLAASRPSGNCEYQSNFHFSTEILHFLHKRKSLWCMCSFVSWLPGKEVLFFDLPSFDLWCSFKVEDKERH